MRIARLICIAAVCMALLPAQTKINGGRTVSGAWDASGASATLPVKAGASLPGSCRQGELFFSTSAAAGQNLYVCSVANSWSQIAGAASGGGALGGPVASIPACGSGTNGEIYFPSDSLYALWCNGTAWQYRLGSAPVTPADNNAFTWVNQGAATASVSGGLTATSGDIFATAPPATGFSPRMRMMANTNALSFTVTALVSLSSTQIAGGGVGTVGIVARNTAGPNSFTNSNCAFQYQMASQYGAGAFSIGCYDSTNTSFAGGPTAGYAYIAPGFPMWMRLKCDGTNFIGQYSTDSGQNWYTAATVPVTSISSTVNQIGWFVSSDQNSKAIPASLLSWNVSTP